MAEAKLVVIYPRPRDIEVFEKKYLEEHVPMAVQRLTGATRAVLTKVLKSPQGTSPPFHRLAEIYFPSIAALEAFASSPGGREAVAHAVEISSGGSPVFLIAEEETIALAARESASGGAAA